MVLNRRSFTLSGTDSAGGPMRSVALPQALEQQQKVKIVLSSGLLVYPPVLCNPWVAFAMDACMRGGGGRLGQLIRTSNMQ